MAILSTSWVHRTLAALSFGLLFSTSATAATVVFFDDFSGEPNPAPAAFVTVTDLAKFSVLPVGANVDVINPLACVLDGTPCLGLDGTGSPSQATVQTKATFALLAGEQYNLSFVWTAVSEPDPIRITLGSALDTTVIPVVGAVSIDFTVLTTELGARLSFSDLDPPDNLGPVIDNIQLTRTLAVPVPATLALLMAGLAGLTYAGRCQ